MNYKIKTLLIGLCILVLGPTGLCLYADSFTVINTNDSGAGSLRQAIIDANNNPGPDTIVFNITQSDPGYQTAGSVSWWRIQPLSALPFLTDNGTIIDGTTQTSNQGNTNPNGPEVEIDGTNAGSGVVDGLTIRSANNTIKGLVINRFSYDGIFIYGSSANNNIIIGNYIGTNVIGTVALGNGLDGVYLCSGPQNNIIGGTTSAERNILSGNDFAGINLVSCSNTRVIGNYIGTDRTGTVALGNYVYGIYIAGAQSETIGGTAPGEPNIIAFNDGPGIILFSGSLKNTLSRNSFFQNNGLAIEIYPPWGVNANDGGDIDTGSNSKLNFPVINSVLYNSETEQTIVSGVIDIDTDPALARVEVSQAAPDPTGYGEGKTYLGTATPDASGNWSITVSGLSIGDYVTAITIDKNGNTSEFSQNKLVPEVDFIIQSGPNNPASSDELNDTSRLPMLQFRLSLVNSGEDVKINSVKLTASGTINDQADISAVRLILDANDNGRYDLGETILAGPAVYSVDNGTLTMTLATPRSISVGNSENWLVVYDLNGTATLEQTIAVKINANADIEAVGATSESSITPTGAPVFGSVKMISDVTASNTSGREPLTVQFASQFGTENTVTQYEWDFDYDGITFRADFSSNLSGDANFTYEHAGDYTALLRVTYADGTVIERTVTITVSAPPGSVNITGISTIPFPIVGPAPLTIIFAVHATTDSGQIEAYFWDFDGDEVIDFTSTITDTATYTYTKAGNYTVTVKVQDTTGLMAEDTLDITVGTPGATPPVADITSPAGPITINLGESVSFEGIGIPSASGTIVKYEWDFDGNGSLDFGAVTNTSISYTYLRAGTFTIKFQVTEEPSGLTGEDTVTITVEPTSAPRVAVVQPGVKQPGKDGLRRMVKGQITIKAVSVPIPATQTLDLRYRLVGPDLPDIFSSPVDDPPEPQDSAWQTEALIKSIFVTADAGAEGFITRLDTSALLDNRWYEIIAVANYHSSDGSYDSWNADQSNKRVFIYIESVSPELEETLNQQTSSVQCNRTNRANRGGQISVSIPYQGITTDTSLTLGVPGSVPESNNLEEEFVNNYHEIELAGETVLQRPARISLRYSDDDNDGIVDGTTIPEDTLIMYRYDSADGKWEPLPNQIVEPDNNIISAMTPDFSIFGMGGIPNNAGNNQTGSSGGSGGKGWSLKCGCLGLEPLLLLALLRFIRRYRPRRKR